MEDDEEMGEVPEDIAGQGNFEDTADMQDSMYDLQQDQQFGGEYPGIKEKESIFSLFKRVLEMKDSSKVGNLDKNKELGMLDLSVRNCEYLALLSRMLHNQSIDEYFMGKAEITLATSMSKRGWLQELFVSQKRFNQRMVQPVIGGGVQPVRKKGFFGFGRKQQLPTQP